MGEGYPDGFGERGIGSCAGVLGRGGIDWGDVEVGGR